MRTVSPAFKSAVFNENTDEMFCCLLTISHSSFTDDIRVTDSNAVALLPIAGIPGIISNGLEYLFTPFTIALPAQNDTGVAEATITVDNVGEEMMGPIRNADSALAINVQICLASQPDVIDLNFDNFQLASVDYDALTVSGTLSMEYYDLEPYPAGRISPSTAPGCF
jgi:hypothetical protein